MNSSWLRRRAALLSFVLAGVAPAAEPAPAKVVCVFCGSSDSVDPKYLAAATRFGEGLAERGWTLLFGGGKSGLMGAVARGAKSRGGRIVSVRPELLEKRAGMFDGVDEAVSVQTIAERKALFQQRADAFVVLPGGSGTLDELADTLEAGQLKLIAKPVVIFDQDNYYGDLLAFFERTIREKFARDSLRSGFAVAKSVGEIFVQLGAPAGK